MDIEWQNIWATTCHSLWIWRNKEKHNNHFIRRPSARNKELYDSRQGLMHGQ
jgi:hypothetical protein